MDDALADWLALREPTDFASRSERLTRMIGERLAGRDPLRVLDLATGTGSNLRYLVDRLPATRQEWLLVDRSARLLELVAHRTRQAGTGRHRQVDIQTRQIDLDTLDDPELFAGRDLVTASALLDLVSDTWLRSLAARCRKVGAVVLFTITYDGRNVCTPAEPDDQLVLELFNRHQHRDKGLGGPAAGPGAADAAVRAFTDAGYHVETDTSDWNLSPSDADLQRELIAGWAFAATETDASRRETIEAWRTRRLDHVRAGRSAIVVGHRDIAAW